MARVTWGVVAITVVMLVVGQLYAGAGAAGPAAGLNETAIAAATHATINDARADNGLPPVSHSAELNHTAEGHAAWMADTTTLEHSERGTYGCAYAGENIAYTYATNVRVSDTRTVDLNRNETRIGRRLAHSWLNSTEHRKNILDSQFQTQAIGIATATVEGRERVYATQALCG